MHGCIASTTNIWDALAMVGCFIVVFTFLGWMLRQSRAAAIEEQVVSTKTGGNGPNDGTVTP
jgi:hypothetical protein